MLRAIPASHSQRRFMAYLGCEIHHRPSLVWMYPFRMTQSGTQVSKVASDPDEPKAVSSREAVDNRPTILAARELIQEAREQVARSQQLIERGRNLREKAEQSMEAFRKRHTSLWAMLPFVSTAAPAARARKL